VDGSRGDVRTRVEYRPGGDDPNAAYHIRVYDTIRQVRYAIDVYPRTQSHHCLAHPLLWSGESSSGESEEEYALYVDRFRWDFPTYLSLDSSTTHNLLPPWGMQTLTENNTPESFFLELSEYTTPQGWRLGVNPATLLPAVFTTPHTSAPPHPPDGPSMTEVRVEHLRAMTSEEVASLFSLHDEFTCIATAREVETVSRRSSRGGARTKGARMSAWMSGGDELPEPPWPSLCTSLPSPLSSGVRYGNWGGGQPSRRLLPGVSR
jgi:hypothetical protein